MDGGITAGHCLALEASRSRLDDLQAAGATAVMDTTGGFAMEMGLAPVRWFCISTCRAPGTVPGLPVREGTEARGCGLGRGGYAGGAVGATVGPQQHAGFLLLRQGVDVRKEEQGRESAGGV